MAGSAVLMKPGAKWNSSSLPISLTTSTRPGHSAGSMLKFEVELIKIKQPTAAVRARRFRAHSDTRPSGRGAPGTCCGGRTLRRPWAGVCPGWNRMGFVTPSA